MTADVSWPGDDRTWPLPEVTDRASWQARVDGLLVREKAHTREGDAIAAARRRLPMVEVVYGRQEAWEDSPPGWPKFWRNDGGQFRANGRPTAQWPRLAAGRSDDLSPASRPSP